MFHFSEEEEEMNEVTSPSRDFKDDARIAALAVGILLVSLIALFVVSRMEDVPMLPDVSFPTQQKLFIK